MSVNRNILSIVVLLFLVFTVAYSVETTQQIQLEASKKYCASLSKFDCILNELTKFTCIWLNNRCEVY
ncbi:hypothetical protein DICPUDRAFT_158540 [Dictyostelium purpureum]|uniref:Transmembrane protein n=1 Tax=Dictyostelium purpureum TaxID=5786 RepID=F1A1V1_DICPU|nr:uncharacterized protein DICPUDRAFT_158540 [Dictyostelium purpureum]EGC29823.1 hypothetical protein DICPUDRAFT_158540 [Dictyostelium purpureum]|eukprot:XP_003293644.1 hypothetical protein DICPUDRAFT_158540 [Dictyostelium purpureum]